MKRIKAADVVFLDVEQPNTPPIIGGVFILDPATAPDSFVRHRDILRYVERRLHLAPNLRRKLVFNPLSVDEPRLINDSAFDLEFHVRHIGLPKPRDRRQLNILCGRLMSRPMDIHRPLWELYIIEGLENVEGCPPDAFAILIRLHHAGFDGAAAHAAIWALTQQAPDEEPPQPDDEWLPERSPDALDWLSSSITEGFKQTFTNLSRLPGFGFRVAKGLMATKPWTGSLPIPLTRFQSRPSSHRVFDWVTFSQVDARHIREALGMPKMNDLVLTIIAGALRIYLGEKGELPVQPLIALCPINVRGHGDPAAGGNEVALMRVPIFTDIEDPLERLTAIGSATVQGKETAKTLGETFIGDFLSLYPYAMRSWAMRSATGMNGNGSALMPKVANLLVTNIPNSTAGHFIAGSKVLSYAGFGPVVEGIGLFHAVSGMDWELSISATCTREMMPDIAHYMDCLHRSYDEVKTLADRALEGARPRRKTASVKTG